MIIDSLLHPFGLSRKHKLDALLAGLFREAGECESDADVYAALDAHISKVVDYDRLCIRVANSTDGTVTDVFVTGEHIPNWVQEARHELAGTATEKVMATGKPLIIDDCTDPAQIRLFPVLSQTGAKLPSLMAVPLMFRGEAIGSIQLRSTRTNAFSIGHAETIQLAASCITPTVVNVNQMALLQREVSERTMLAEIGRAASSTIDFGLVWDQLVSTVTDLMPCDRMVMALIDDDYETITDRFVFGIPIPGWDDDPRKPLNALPAANIISTSKRAVIFSTEDNDAAFRGLMGFNISEKVGLRSTIFAPLIAGDQIIGTLSIRSVLPDAYASKDLALFERLAMQIGGPVAAAELYSRTVRLAEERASRERLETVNRQLEETNVSKSRFVTAISHELRTPLTSIIAFSDLMRSNKTRTLSERDQNHLEVIRRNGQRLKALIEDLLDLSNIESASLTVTRSEFEIEDTIEEVVTSMAPILGPKQQGLSVSFAEPGIRIESDRDRIGQIVSNLVSNAGKFSSDHSEIRIEVSFDDGEVKIAVIDSGVGIEENELPLIFNEFSHIASETTWFNRGTGLGLAVSRKLARMLGGDIEVASKMGEGSVFTLTLPARQAKAA